MAGPSGLPLPFCELFCLNRTYKTAVCRNCTAQHRVVASERRELTEMKSMFTMAFFGRITFQTPEWRCSSGLVEWRKHKLGFKNARVPRTYRGRHRT